MEEVELLGARSTTRAATMALSPGHKFLAAGTAARTHTHAGWDDSRVDILKLWNKEGEPDRGRKLEVVATIPAPSNRAFHRLAWSASDASNSEYPLGLLAGALDDGTICIWDPSVLEYELNMQGDEGAPRFTLSAFSSGFFGEPSKRSHQTHGGNQYQKKEVKKAASERTFEYDNLVKDKFTEFTLDPKISPGDLNDWEILTNEDQFDVEDWELLTHDESDVENWVLPEMPDGNNNHGLLLKLNDIGGQVFGLAFSHQHGNCIACAGSFEKIKLFHLDHPMKSYELADLGSSSRTTFLEWHPHYPVAIATSSDSATASIWDLRTKIAALSFNQRNKHCSEIHWSPNDPLEFVVGSIGEDTTVKIWDCRQTKVELIGFGPEKGVVSLSWSGNQNRIITTNVDGGVDGWKLNVIEGPDPSRTVYLPPDRTSLPLGEKEEIVWFTDDQIATSSPTNIGLYKLKPPCS